MADAHQQGRHDNLHRQSTIPGEKNLGTVGVMNAATDSAKRLHTQGVSVRQLYDLLQVSHILDMILGSSLQCINQNVERLVAEHIVVGHVPCTRTAMDTFTMSQHGCRCQENLPNGSCCQTYPMSHAVQHDERQQASGDAHFISAGIPSNVPCAQQSAITSGSLDQRPGALDPRLSPSRQACTSKDRKARVWANSGPYSRGRHHCFSTAAGARQAEQAEAGSLCHLCGQEPAASDLGYPECWECFFGMHR